MSELEARLLELLKERSFARGNYSLSSGDSSSYYIDGKMTEVNSLGAYLIGEALYERTKDLPITAIGGLEAGAIPLATSTVISYQLHGRAMDGFWVRDKIKGHGTRKLIEGKLTPGSRIVVIDDVVTKGSSVIRAIEEVKKQGCEVVQVIAIVDRLQGAAQLFREHGVEVYRPIFTIRDFGVETDVPNATRCASV